MSPTTWGWLVLLFPLLGTIIIGLGFRSFGRTAGVIGTAAIGLAFVCAVGCLISLLGRTGAHREVVSSLWNYDVSAGVDARIVQQWRRIVEKQGITFLPGRRVESVDYATDAVKAHLDDGTAIVRGGSGWRVVGDGTVVTTVRGGTPARHRAGELPALSSP